MPIQQIVYLLFISILAMPQGFVFAQDKAPIIPKPLAPLKRDAVAKTSVHTDNPTFDLMFTWDSIQGVWDTVHQMTYTYNPDGSMLAQDYAIYSQGVFRPEQHYDYYKDTAGLDEMIIRKQYLNGNWVDEIKWTQFVNPQGNFRNDMTYSWTGSSWDSSSTYREYLKYGSSNEILSSERLSWEYWRSEPYRIKTEYHYNSQVLPDTITFWELDNTWKPKQRWVDISWHDHSLFLTSQFTQQLYFQNTWIYDHRYTNTYGANNGVEQLTEYYDLTGGVWQNQYWNLTRKDDLGHETYSEDRGWAGNASGYFPYIGYDSTEYVYDTDGNTIESIFRKSDTLVLHNKVRHVYGDFFTSAGTPVLPPSSVSAFPNPATDAIYFDLGDTQHGPVDIELYDMLGRKLFAVSTTYIGQAIRLPFSERISQATYVYRVFARGGVSEGKVIVQR
jgi:hypothetical protein